MAKTGQSEFFGSLHSEFVRDKLCEDADVLRDLELAFTSKNIRSKQGYSTGSTFFIAARDEPQCFLELLAQQVFLLHSQRLGKTISAGEGGAEWWSQVIDSRDDIGWHWDRDYGKEEEGFCLYPDVATVTYLKSNGGATVVTNMRGQKANEMKSVGWPIGKGTHNRVCISKPQPGKHLYFDGDCLHGAPSDLNEDNEESNDSDDDDDDDDDDTEEEGDGGDASKRITFLVNCWFDHRPIEATRLPNEIASAMSSARKREVQDFFDTATKGAVSRQRIQQIDTGDCRTWNFSDCKRKYRVGLPLHAMREKVDLDGLGAGETVEFCFTDNKGTGYVALHDLGEQSDPEEEEDEEEDEEEGEGEVGPSLKRARA